jgi:hypothetical protein
VPFGFIREEIVKLKSEEQLTITGELLQLSRKLDGDGLLILKGFKLASVKCNE